MSSSVRKSGILLITAVFAIALAIPAHAVLQSESATVTVAGAENPTEIASSGSSSSKPDRTEVATTLPAGPSMGSPAAIPAPAMIAPVRNAQKSGEKRPELPKKTFFSLALLNHAGVAFDSYSTRRLVESGGSELNPVLRPLADSNGLYAAMQIWPTAMDYLGAKMARSRKPWVRKMWWVPQTATGVSSIVIGARNLSLANSSVK